MGGYYGRKVSVRRLNIDDIKNSYYYLDGYLLDFLPVNWEGNIYPSAVVELESGEIHVVCMEDIRLIDRDNINGGGQC